MECVVGSLSYRLIVIAHSRPCRRSIAAGEFPSLSASRSLQMIRALQSIYATVERAPVNAGCTIQALWRLRLIALAHCASHSVDRKPAEVVHPHSESDGT